MIWLAAGGIVLAALNPIIRRSRRKQLEEFAATGIAHGMFGPHRVELRPEGMVDATEGYEWLTRWAAIDRVEESEGAFLIYTGPNAYLPIPHSAFRDSASLRRFSDVFYRLREAGRAPHLAAPESTPSEQEEAE